MTTIAVIPARGGSKRIPRKNIRPFLSIIGLPIIAYSIHTAMETKMFDRILVSTEDEGIAHVAIEYGAEVIHRPAELADDLTGTQEVMKHAVSIGHDIKYACCIYPTSPLMCEQDIYRGWQEVAIMHARYALSVGYPPLQDAGQFYWGTAEAFKSGEPLIGGETAMVLVDSSRVCDINTEEDWRRAEKMYRQLYGARA